MVSIKNLLVIASAVSAAVLPRDAAQVLNDLHTINSDTTTLTNAANNYNGGFSAAVPIINAESALEKDLKTATDDTNASGTVSEADAQNILNYITNTLEPSIKTSLTAIKNKKAKFDADGLTPTVRKDLNNLKSGTDTLGSALLAHTPSDLTAKAQAVQAKIDADFQDAINFFA